MEFVNCFDEQNRFMSLKVFDNHKSLQIDSHGLSYLGARKQYQEMGYVMGFDSDLALYKVLEEHELVDYIPSKLWR